MNYIKTSINQLASLCHSEAYAAGWWTDSDGSKKTPDVPRLLCLIHSEISEAMEGDRKDLADDKLPHRKMLEVELGDAVIRIMDMAGAMGMDIGGAIAEKIEFNRSREDHKLANRKLEGGKKY